MKLKELLKLSCNFSLDVCPSFSVKHIFEMFGSGASLHVFCQRWEATASPCVCVHKQVDSPTAGGYLYAEWDGANCNQETGIKSYTHQADVQMSDVLFYLPRNFNQKPIPNYMLVSCTGRMSTWAFANKHKPPLEVWSEFMEVLNTIRSHQASLHIHSSLIHPVFHVIDIF